MIIRTRMVFNWKVSAPFHRVEIDSSTIRLPIYSRRQPHCYHGGSRVDWPEDGGARLRHAHTHTHTRARARTHTSGPTTIYGYYELRTRYV